MTDAGAGDSAIRKLDDDTIAKIAAGEVVERPASVVKELVENSLDADASRIDVTVENGGIDRIEITDNGLGMSEADLRMAVREHTTSKLADAEDLHRVGTLGFRGEALHTIGAVSRLTITSTERDGDGTGTRLSYTDGEIEAVEPAGHPVGTTITVEELFFNTPARRKYLSDASTEFRHVSRIVGRYALANPDVAISLTHGDRETFSTTGNGDLQSAIMAVYGREVAESMVRVEAEPDGPLDRIEGYVSHPETTRSRAAYISGFINDRYVDSDAIKESTVEAYGGQLAADRYPFAVLFVELPSEVVDVNVHPQKMAVRFENESGVRTAVEAAVRDALLEAGLLRSSAPRGRSAPAETAIESEKARSQQDVTAVGSNSGADGLDGAADGNGGSPGSSTRDEGVPGSSTRDEGVPEAGESTSASRPAGTESRSGTDSRSTSETDPDTTEPSASDSPDSVPGGSRYQTGKASGSTPSEETTESVDPSGAASPRAGDLGSGSRPPSADRKFDATEQRTLDGEATSTTEAYDRLPALRVLGQAHDTFLVAESPDGIVLIDQHAADERVHYERLQAALDDGTTQTLAQPVELSLTPAEAAVVDDYQEALARLGFHVERDGQRLLVRSVPAILGEQLPPERLRDAFSALLDADEAAAEQTVSALESELLGDLACAPAVTGNTSLTDGSVTGLLAALDDCENPYACPHGRPTIIELDTDELEDRFERDYPGHGNRR